MFKKILIISCISLSILAGKPKQTVHPYLQLLVSEAKITQTAAKKAKDPIIHTVIDYHTKQKRITHEWILPQKSERRKEFTDMQGNMVVKSSAGTYIKMIETKLL